MSDPVKLTQYSHGGGCGCKIAPGVLEEILHGQYALPDDARLLVGNHSNDDAAVYDLGNGGAVISTTDFFMPIVNDAFDFGRIASANAISDVYAMGGSPIMAIAVLGWPVNVIPAAVARQVLDGSRAICGAAGIPLAGGHSIDAPEPIFGLAVTGLVANEHLKRNNTAQEGDHLFLTKRLGVGILATAQKRELISAPHFDGMVQQLTQLNSIGAQLGKIKGVHAMTDVTGFGLLGHLSEMARGSGLGARLMLNNIKLLEGAQEYLAQKVAPGATARNLASVSSAIQWEVSAPQEDWLKLLCDPQTNGGLLVSVGADAVEEVKSLLSQNGYALFAEPIGQLVNDSSNRIVVQ